MVFSPFVEPWVSEKTPGEARLYAQDAVAGQSAEVVEVTELVVSELVTNVLRHVLGPLWLEIEVVDGLIVVRCTDGSPAALSLADSYGTEAGHGYGLLLVSRLAKSVAVSSTTKSKTITVTVDPDHVATVGKQHQHS